MLDVPSSQWRIHRARRSPSITVSATHQINGSVSWARACSAVRSGPPSGTFSNGSSTKGEGMSVVALEHHCMECRAARVAHADPYGQASHVWLRARNPAERVRGELAPMADELAKGAAIYAPAID